MTLADGGTLNPNQSINQSMANMISDIYDAILENISCQRSLLVLCSIRISLTERQQLPFLGVSFSLSYINYVFIIAATD